MSKRRKPKISLPNSPAWSRRNRKIRRAACWRISPLGRSRFGRRPMSNACSRRARRRRSRLFPKSSKSPAATIRNVAVDFVRIRLDDGPLARLRDRNQLDRDDKARNLALAEAGEKYRQDFFSRRTRSLALDRSSPRKSPPPIRPTVSGAAKARSRRCKNSAPRARLSRKISATPLAAIVCNEREPVDVGREIGAYKDAKMAGAVALFILRRGLAALARHYRMISAAAA